MTMSLQMASLCQKEANALNIVTMLADAGADLNAHDDFFQYTALHLAVIKNRPKLVKLMLHMGCDVNPYYCRLSPLFVAARNKCSQILLIMEPMFKKWRNVIAHCKMPLFMMMSRLFDVMLAVQHSTRDIST